MFFDKAWNKFLETQTKCSNLYLRYHTSNDVGKRPKWKSSKAYAIKNMRSERN